jgi:hypothetical protein
MSNNSPVLLLCHLFVQVLGRRSIFIFFRSIFLATPIEVLVNFLVLSALTEAILSRSTDLCHLFQSRDCHCSFRTKPRRKPSVNLVHILVALLQMILRHLSKSSMKLQETRSFLVEIMEARCVVQVSFCQSNAACSAVVSYVTWSSAVTSS